MTGDDIDLITLNGSLKDWGGLAIDDPFPELGGHALNVVLVQVEFSGDLRVRPVQPHEIETPDPGAQGEVMTFPDRPRQVVKAPPAGLVAVPLAMFLGRVATELDDVLSLTMRAENTLGPAHLPNGFEALGVVDEVLDLHQPSAGRVFEFPASVSAVFLPERAYATGALLSSLPSRCLRCAPTRNT